MVEVERGSVVEQSNDGLYIYGAAAGVSRVCDCICKVNATDIFGLTALMLAARVSEVES